jgi:hypothetical protein
LLGPCSRRELNKGDEKYNRKWYGETRKEKKNGDNPRNGEE